jgi:hypothetical protein
MLQREVVGLSDVCILYHVPPDFHAWSNIMLLLGAENEYEGPTFFRLSPIGHLISP